MGSENEAHDVRNAGSNEYYHLEELSWHVQLRGFCFGQGHITVEIFLHEYWKFWWPRAMFEILMNQILMAQ